MGEQRSVEPIDRQGAQAGIGASCAIVAREEGRGAGIAALGQKPP